MHGFTNVIIATKGKGKIADAATYFGQRHFLLDDPCGFNEINGIIIMFFQTGGYCEYVWIKYYILRVITNLFS